MKHSQLLEVNQDMLKLAEHIRLSKNKEYSSEADALANFKKASAEYGVDPQVVLGIFMDKHLASIRTHIHVRQLGLEPKGTEPFRERIADAINYLLFLDALEYEFLTGLAAAPFIPAQNEPKTGNQTPVKEIVYPSAELSPTEQASVNLLVGTGVQDV
jgi:hypothetical protein